MSSKKLLTIFGATGNQGGSVICTILNSPALSAKHRAPRIADLDNVLGSKVAYNNVAAEVYKSFLPEAIAEELTENMKLMDQYSYYGKNTEKEQAESDAFLLKDAKLATVSSWARSLNL